ncbi:hypothetical protein BAS06_09335 [Elizabethkingia miricola]|uniref:hypothetical protein n=1 Tax=Elizabethkingia miricola TaxID=172045 RepID=UPI000999231C|nr:hypothetical protein [Elizabethkingia miricola]MDV3880746.1 hypothetical protein [Elizabethkingia anophelis]OPB90511.1 hypothetical protein BAS06_09335 [Elizabethkingia miricola]
MIVIHDTIGSGKTTKLIQLSAETGAIIVTINLKSADRIERMAKELLKAIPQPITYTEFINGNYYAPGVRGLLFDDIDLFLISCAKVPVFAMTVNKDHSLPEYRNELEEYVKLENFHAEPIVITDPDIHMLKYDKRKEL